NAVSSPVIARGSSRRSVRRTVRTALRCSPEGRTSRWVFAGRCQRPFTAEGAEGYAEDAKGVEGPAVPIMTAAPASTFRTGQPGPRLPPAAFAKPLRPL